MDYTVEKLEELHKLIPEGKNNAISRKDFANILGTDDRTARKIIQDIRPLFAVCSNTGKGGYYRPANEEEWNRFYIQQMSYINSIWKGIRPKSIYKDDLEGQVKFL